ncbi:hypothetical protein D3C78_1389540 [compost metagenome]
MLIFQCRHRFRDLPVLILMEQRQIAVHRGQQIGLLEVDDIGILAELAATAEGIIEPLAVLVTAATQAHRRAGGGGVEAHEFPDHPQITDGGVIAQQGVGVLDIADGELPVLLVQCKPIAVAYDDPVADIAEHGIAGRLLIEAIPHELGKQRIGLVDKLVWRIIL